MANTVFQNEVLEAKLTELLNSKLEVRSLMTIDDSLALGAGLVKTINRYTYTGEVEELSGGEANSICGSISFIPESYVVKRYQQTFRYNDVEAMQDPSIVDMALAGAADVMANQIRREYFRELLKTSRRHAYEGAALTYTDIVEALTDIGREVEDGLFIILSSASRASLRLDPDFIAARQGEIIYTGQIGTLCGLPVLCSNLVPSGKAIITDKNAVKFFVKKEASLEQARDIETKVNTVVYERHGLIALVDDTASVILGSAAPAVTASGEYDGGFAEITVTDSVPEGGSVRYMIGADAPLDGDDLTSWSVVDGKIECSSDDKFAVAVCDKNGYCVGSCKISLSVVS